MIGVLPVHVHNWTFGHAQGRVVWRCEPLDRRFCDAWWDEPCDCSHCTEMGWAQ